MEQELDCEIMKSIPDVGTVALNFQVAQGGLANGAQQLQRNFPAGAALV